ncbi:hypothetical protein RIR_jg26434.t1 [Rhizophagus irregularis DAOM 181602=DAOM 197198]|uniref:Uncharacterized protein n=1 Tax=Rhizophagus irregularis (strain DAOM 197198w) TaxID=1432141 RepID=A0A015ISU2_RHIIW|nr:hypothetical protein RirG_208090 [Rhizophagus irregularis DAOM 197198w]GBC51780.1 hypothetical protein RIR_jg26434.t1 [Rhizophagus irregularis DAOM 181602=DAOM 197198]
MRKHQNLKQISEFCTANQLCRMSSDMQPIIDHIRNRNFASQISYAECQPIIDHIRNLSEIWPKFGQFALLPICLISTSGYTGFLELKCLSKRNVLKYYQD